MDKVKPLYLAGPMTGFPQFNFPLFDRASRNLREAGFNIISPHELDSELVREVAMCSEDGDLAAMEADTQETWGQILARDVEMLADKCSGIVFLPLWNGSRGAVLEATTAILSGHSTFYEYEEFEDPYLPERLRGFDLTPLPPKDVVLFVSMHLQFAAEEYPNVKQAG